MNRPPRPEPAPWARFARVARALAATPDGAVRFGQTPRAAVMTRDGATLHRYLPTLDPRPDAAPLLIVHGLIGRAEVVDLEPGRSLVQDLLRLRFDPWIIHWGAPPRAERWLRFEDYALDRLPAFAARIAQETGRRPALMGVCEGGLLTAFMAAVEPARVPGLVLAVTPVDIDAAPDAALTRLVRSFTPEMLAATIDHLGGLPGAALAAAFQNLTPSRTLAKYTVDLMRMDGRPDKLAHFLRMERWLADRPDHPAEAARQLLIDIYWRNAFARGEMLLDGAPARLSDITAPTLAILGLRDHLVPPASARGAKGRTAGPYAELALDAGHIGVFVSRRARGRVAAALADFLTSQAVLTRTRV